MTVSEKAAYIKGLMEGMDIDTSKGEGKLFAKIVDLLEDLSLTVLDLEDETATLNEYIEELDEDLGAVEEELYCDEGCDCCDDCFDDCDCCDCCDFEEDDFDCDCCDCEDDCDCCDCLELECPNCNEPVYIDEEDIYVLEEVECPSCGAVLAINVTEECDCCCGDCEDEEACDEEASDEE